MRVSFSAFCNRVEKEGKTCYFCDCTNNAICNAEGLAIRDQIVIGTLSDQIREKALFESWDIAALRENGMKIGSAALGRDAINDKQGQGKNIAKGPSKTVEQDSSRKCYRCGDRFNSSHIKKCKALKARCSNCDRVGHYMQRYVLQELRSKLQSTPNDEEETLDTETYRLNIWKIKASQNVPKFVAKDNNFRS